MKKCCLCCLQTTTSPKMEIRSISYASFEATGTVHVIPLSLHYWGPSSVYRRGYIYLENGITLNYQNQWLEICSYDYLVLVTSWFYKTIYGATPSGHDRQSYHPLFIFSTMMRPTSRLLSLILMIWKRLKFTEPDKNKWGLVSCKHFWNSFCVA